LNIVIDAAVENTTNVPLTAELDIPHSVEELSKAIDSLAGSKAPENDGIQPEVIKTARETFSLTTCTSWQGTVPQEICDTNIITLCKNKADCGYCNNF